MYGVRQTNKCAQPQHLMSACKAYMAMDVIRLQLSTTSTTALRCSSIVDDINYFRVCTDNDFVMLSASVCDLDIYYTKDRPTSLELCPRILHTPHAIHITRHSVSDISIVLTAAVIL